MRCLFLLYLFLHKYAVVPYQEGKTFQSPNYPNPYTEKLSQRTTCNVNFTQGVAVVFEQFLASAHDCVIACPLDDEGCTSICGDAMDHGLVPKILKVPGDAVISMVSIDSQDGFPHSGIKGKIIPFDLEKNSFFDCSSTFDISSGETFYLISQNYPSTPTSSFSGCSLSFTTSGLHQGIRFAVYDFQLGALDKFEIAGKSGMKNQGDHVEITGFATEDEPVVFYFRQSANVTFSIDTTQKTFYGKRFYILVKSYEIANTNLNGCYNQWVPQTIQLGDWCKFGTQTFGKSSYADNLQCEFNFTRTDYNYSMFALAIQYETEKCCDTMSINGLSQWEEVYQGYQYSNMFFTYNRALSFFFQSDPVVGGSGFSATLQHLDCTCPPSQLLVDFVYLTSPGYQYNAISYCPNMFCQPQLVFQDDLYDLRLSFDDIDLRTYSLSNNTDSLTTSDAYGHQMVQILPGYFGFTNFFATVSPVTVTFVSNYVSAVPLNMAGRGFSIALHLIEKYFIRETVTFTEGNFFKDISKLNLASPLNLGATYEFIINGRKGHKISMYFFTKTTNQVFIDIYDGDSTDAVKLDNKALYSNIQENGVSYQLTTSGEHAIVRIRMNPTYYQDGTDFEAMITDVGFGNNCGSFVYSLKESRAFDNVQLHGQNCYTILHISDYSQTAFMNIWLSKLIDMNIYLGLNTNDSNLIFQNLNDTLPQDIFTNYLVFQYSTNDLINLHFNRGDSNGIVARVMQPSETVMIMSADYGKSDTSPLIQQFSVQLEGESNVQTGLRVDFLTDSGIGQSNFTWSKYDEEVTKKSLSLAKKGTTLSSCGNKLLVDYTSPGGGSGNGLYLKITRADLRCSHSSSKSVASMFLFLLVLVFLKH